MLALRHLHRTTTRTMECRISCPRRSLRLNPYTGWRHSRCSHPRSLARCRRCPRSDQLHHTTAVHTKARQLMSPTNSKTQLQRSNSRPLRASAVSKMNTTTTAPTQAFHTFHPAVASSRLIPSNRCSKRRRVSSTRRPTLRSRLLLALRRSLRIPARACALLPSTSHTSSNSSRRCIITIDFRTSSLLQNSHAGTFHPRLTTRMTTVRPASSASPACLRQRLDQRAPS